MEGGDIVRMGMGRGETRGGVLRGEQRWGRHGERSDCSGAEERNSQGDSMR